MRIYTGQRKFKIPKEKLRKRLSGKVSKSSYDAQKPVEAEAKYPYPVDLQSDTVPPVP